MTAPNDPRRSPSARGFALFVVLWFLVLLAAVGTYLLANARTEVALARNIRAAAHAEALADAGIARAVFDLTDPAPEGRWRLDGTEYRLTLSDGEITIRLGDEAQKIDPNVASASLMAALFETLGVERNRANQLGNAVAAWVRPLAKDESTAADEKPYRDAGLDYVPPHRPVDSLDELRLVTGMTPAILAAAQPYLSIYTGDDAPAIETASGVVHAALELAAASDEGEQDELSAGNGSATPSSSQPIETAPTVVDIEVGALSADGGQFVRHAVVRLMPDLPKGYVALAWSREVPKP